MYEQYEKIKPCKVEVLLDVAGWSRIEFLDQGTWEEVRRGRAYRIAMPALLAQALVCYDVTVSYIEPLSTYKVGDFHFTGRYVQGRPVLDTN